jgi:hypothetical protein
VPKPALTPTAYLSIPEIREQLLPLDRHTLQKLFLGQPGVLITGRRETADQRKYRKLLVPRHVAERVVREMTVRG